MLIEHDECPKYLWTVLLIIAGINLIRGLLHTVFVNFAATNIAGLDLTIAGDELRILMISYGWSNIIEAILYIIIATKSRNLVPAALIIAGSFVPLAMINIRSLGISMGGAAWNGGPMMTFLFMPLCYLPVIYFYLQRRRNH